jgi:DNA polymerase I-like protein with 3'-5' exonuclease and polymerase domains
MLTSRFPDGCLKQIDFTSLEPRIALSLVGKNPPRDIYNLINKEIFSSSVSRQTAKLATICLLYGGGKSRMKEITGRKGPELDKIISKLDEYFGASTVSNELERQLSEQGYITNYYDRPIFVKKDAPRHVLYNNFIQSTAVDVALEGFRKIVANMRVSGMKSLPVFVLHDALIIDVHPSEMKQVSELCDLSEKISGFESKFYLDLEGVS